MDINNIKKLRNETKAGYMLCKEALNKNDGDIEKAKKYLYNKGFSFIKDNKKGKNGIISSYIHSGNRIGSLVEVTCDTDFSAKTEYFQQFVKEISMQVASMKPKYISRKDVPVEVLTSEMDRKISVLKENNEEYNDDVLFAGLEQWFREVCLLEQPYIRDYKKSIKDILNELIIKLKENCKIERFERWEIGVEEEEEENTIEVPLKVKNNSIKTYSFIMLIFYAFFLGLLISTC